MPSSAYMRNRQLNEEERHNRELERTARNKAIADTAVGAFSALAGFGGRVIPGLAKLKSAAHLPQGYSGSFEKIQALPRHGSYEGDHYGNQNY